MTAILASWYHFLWKSKGKISKEVAESSSESQRKSRKIYRDFNWRIRQKPNRQHKASSTHRIFWSCYEPNTILECFVLWHCHIPALYDIVT